MKHTKPQNWQRPPQIRLNIDDELVIDNFAGGGGASMGIEQAIGRSVDIAINHDQEAIAMHEANHPETEHHCEDVFNVDPVEVCKGRPVGLAWFSPDCKHFSKAKGGKPVSKKIRGLARIAIKWARLVKPRIIVLENVEEFKDWGPLLENNKPCPDRKGMEFRRFVNGFIKLGYHVEWRELRADAYGAPTIRKRLFLIARCDGRPIVWPAATHGKGKGLQPHNTAADCIDWSHPCHSIFLTKDEGKKVNAKRPLAESTMRRIGKGVFRYVLNSADPFIIPIAYYHKSNHPAHNINEPLRTVTASPKGGCFALVSAFLAKHYTGVTGHEVTKPFGTVTAVDHHSVVTSHMVKLRNNGTGQDVREPLHTVTSGGNHHGEVRAFLVKYYGTDQHPRLDKPMHTITSKDRMGLVTVHGQQYRVVDIGMRMLQPRELYRAQGFPDEYIIAPYINGKRISKAAQVRMCGNSVSPPIARAIIKANYSAANALEATA